MGKEKSSIKSKTNSFYLKTPEKILQSINDKIKKEVQINIFGLDLILLPNVYPSQCFRTTNFLLKNISLRVKDKSICDMGCGMGIVGLFALKKGAKKVVQADINPNAVKNAIANKKFYNYEDSKLSVYESDCFTNIPNQQFDIIIFNIPFHSKNYHMKDYMDWAFFDPHFTTLRKFLSQLKYYAHSTTEIIIAFSNKGSTEKVEYFFEKYGYDWQLWRKVNGKTKFDNRLYLLKL